MGFAPCLYPPASPQTPGDGCKGRVGQRSPTARCPTFGRVARFCLRQQRGAGGRCFSHPLSSEPRALSWFYNLPPGRGYRERPVPWAVWGGKSLIQDRQTDIQTSQPPGQAQHPPASTTRRTSQALEGTRSRNQRCREQSTATPGCFAGRVRLSAGVSEPASRSGKDRQTKQEPRGCECQSPVSGQPEKVNSYGNAPAQSP